VNIGSQNEITMRELAETIIRLVGSRSRIVNQPLPADDPKVRRADNTLAREKLGWDNRVPPEDGLRRTIEYFEKELSKGGA